MTGTRSVTDYDVTIVADDDRFALTAQGVTSDTLTANYGTHSLEWKFRPDPQEWIVIEIDEEDTSSDPVDRPQSIRLPLKEAKAFAEWLLAAVDARRV